MGRENTYGTAAFAALAGVTPRALRHYDRLGLLKPRRSANGYRCYVERDLQALEEIVALKFIGVPLKDIAGIRRRSKGPFAGILRAQRETLEARRRTLTTAIDAVAAAEALIRSGGAIDADAMRRIIEVMHMEQTHEQLVETYAARLKAKVQHMQTMSPAEREAMRGEWGALQAELKAALAEDPAGPVGQRLLDRWLSLRRRFTGESATVPDGAPTLPMVPPPELRDELWARRADWLPEATVGAVDPDRDRALGDLRARAESMFGHDVLVFIARAQAARG